MSARIVDGGITLAEAARKCRDRETPRAAPPDLDALLVLLRATLTGIDTAERPLDPPDRREPR